ncbi:hemerythrin domain-containing protein [Lutimaribacter marinistellae]|uniref:Hemerythrin domain-containing protein n=1 Tax=Lutimaribacter marinistellae TaxID=1820329 RepID=A0ABV7TJD5_9RHOB
MADAMNGLALGERDGLPDALRVLLEDCPREGWQMHPGFDGLVRFWLERHLMFRDLMDRMGHETERFLDAKSDAVHFARSISRFGGVFVNQLHGHHQIEDHHYFPLLRQKDPRIAAGFDLLDADHHALDGLLNDFVTRANAAIQGVEHAQAQMLAAQFRDGLADLEHRIGQHLEDEEDLVVPVILTFGAEGLG